MAGDGGKGRNRRGEASNRVSEQGYAISEYRRLINCGNPRCLKCRTALSRALYERFR